jgi:hypothetical protein
MYARDMMAGTSTKAESVPNLPVGEQNITSNVTVVYEIK